MKLISTKTALIIAFTVNTIAICGNSYAQLITIKFEGSVNFVSNDLANEIEIGNTFSGLYTYDSQTIDTNPDSSTVGNYTQAINELSFSVGNLSFTKGSDSNNINWNTDIIQILNNNDLSFDGTGGVDSYYANVPILSGPDINGISASEYRFTMSLTDPTELSFTSDSLNSNLNLTSFTNSNPDLQPQLLLYSNSSAFNSPLVSSSITSITTVPIPASIYLFSSGLIGLIGLYRRKA